MLSPAVLAVIAVCGAIELILVGWVGAHAAVRFGFAYAKLTPVAYLVYGATGYFVVRAGGSGAVGGALVGLLDALSWASFGGLGPQPASPKLTLGAKGKIVAMVTLTALVAGLVGGWLAGRAADLR